MNNRNASRLVQLFGIFWLISTTVACAGAPTAPASAAPSTPAAAGISRKLLDQHDLPDMPGWEERLYLVQYGPGVAAPVHHHPVEGLGYVVSGSFESAFEGEATTRVTAGQSFRELALKPHTVFRNPDSSQALVFVIAFVVRHGVAVTETP